MITRANIHELAEAYEQPIVLLEPKKFDDALIGYCRDALENLHAVYDEGLLIETIMKDGMSEEDARERYEYETRRSLIYMGDYAPLIISREYEV